MAVSLSLTLSGLHLEQDQDVEEDGDDGMDGNVYVFCLDFIRFVSNCSLHPDQ